MSSIYDKNKSLIKKRERISLPITTRNSFNKENKTDIKIKEIINLLYLDNFHQILIFSKNQYLNYIEKKFDKVILENYPEYTTYRKEYINSLKNEIVLKYISENQLLKKGINNYIKNPKNFTYITNFIPHCQKTDKIASHNCLSSLSYGKFIKVNNNKKDNINYAICVECHKCYKSDMIEMYCSYCQKNYYSLILDDNKNILYNKTKNNLPLATWEKYHCGFIIDEIMKCVKCKSNFYYDNIKNKLVCLNKKCRFEAKPKRIIWKCSFCSLDFTSPVKPYNPIEIKMYKNAINYALIIKEKAKPNQIKICQFCGGDISKSTFYHKKDCGGELLMSKLDKEEVIVCNRCHSMNFYSQYSWRCPLCNKKLKKRKDILGFIKSNDNSTNKNQKYDKDVFNFDNERVINDYNYDKNKYMDLNNKKSSLRNYLKNSFSYYSLTRNPFHKNYNSHIKNKLVYLTQENSNSSISKRDSSFSIRNLFMKNDSKRKNNKSTNIISSNSITSHNKSKISNSLGREKKGKSTLFDILQKRNSDKASSFSRGKKNSLINKTSTNILYDKSSSFSRGKKNSLVNKTSTNILYDKASSFSRGKKNSLINKASTNNSNIEISNTSITKSQYIYQNYRKNITKGNILKEKFYKTEHENNSSIYNLEQDKPKNKIESSNKRKYDKLKKEKLCKKVTINLHALEQKRKNEEKKTLIIKSNYNSKKLIDYYKSFTSFDKEKEKQKQKNNTESNIKIEEELEKIKIDNYINNNKYIKPRIVDKKNNIGKINKEKKYDDKKEIKYPKEEITKIFKRSYILLPNSNINNKTITYGENYKLDLKEKNNQNYKNNLNEYKTIPSEEQKNKKINKIQNYTKPIKNYIRVNTIYMSKNTKTIEKQEEKKESRGSARVSLFKKKYENNPIVYKPVSRRRFYQNLIKNSKDKINKNKVKEINTTNYIDDINEHSLKSNELDIYNMNNLSNSIRLKESKINYYWKESSINKSNNNTILNTNSNTNTNNDNNNIKNNSNINDNSKDNYNNNDDEYSNIKLFDFDINYERTNKVLNSRIKINKEINIQSNLIYNPKKIEEMMLNCNIPKFEDTDFCYEDSVGEGSFGTIYEVEEIKTGKKYAIKKVICKDVQELIQQKSQLELLYSFNHDNILKIHKVQFKILDFSTYSINVLMDLAISDWGQEILNRAKTKNYYKEEELINITRQIINGLLYLKSKNISHRDIKPQNILIFPNNNYKLSDFGEAKIVKNLSSLRTLKGCELYMSPALYWGWIHGKKNLKHNIFKSDVFSLGYCLLYAITLNINILEKIRNLTENKSILNIIYKYLNENNFSPKFKNIISKMININEEERYDIENLYKDLKNLNN